MPRRQQPFHYNPDDIRDSLATMQKIRGMQIEAGTHPGMATLAQPIPMDNHHCITCGEKTDFQVENEETMANGALRRSGTCQKCGGVVSKYVKGAKPKSQVS